MTEGAGLNHILELGGPDIDPRSLEAISHGCRIAQIGVLTGLDAAPHIMPMQFKLKFQSKNSEFPYEHPPN